MPRYNENRIFTKQYIEMQQYLGEKGKDRVAIIKSLI
jgi:hypothetical protein